MEPVNSTERSSITLPAPVGAQPTQPMNPLPQVPGQASYPGVGSLPQSSVPNAGQLPIATNPISQPVAAQPVHTDTVAVADDGDLIEKEWVDRAKRVVRNTLQDPYQQSKELTALKLEYMKKRYNREIRQSE